MRWTTVCHCICRNFPLMPASFELTELGRYYLDYERLMSHWQGLFGDDIATVDYEDLVLDQEKVSRQLVDHIGLDWDPACLDFQKNERNVSSPSNLQVRQPIYSSSIERWEVLRVPVGTVDLKCCLQERAIDGV